MMQLLRALPIRNRLWLMLLLATVGMALLSGYALTQLKSKALAERNLKTKHLVEAAHSVIAGQHRRFQQGHISEQQAKAQALSIVRGMRYDGDEYFWINDKNGLMLMHPFSAKLEGEQVIDLKDTQGKPFFREMVETVRQQGEGSIDYYWNKPGSEQPEPKVSYAKAFAPWGWIVASGIYVDDLEQEFWQEAGWFGMIAGGIMLLLLGGAWLIASSITRPLQDTVAAMRDIGQGEGDLTCRLPQQGKDEITALTRHFNIFVDKIHASMKQVEHSTEQVASAAEELAAATEQSGQSMRQQSRETDQVATAINQMNATVQEVARNAGDAATAASDADQAALSGHDQVAHTISNINTLADEVQRAATVIHQLRDNSDNISTVLDVIHTVAEQTNLLALNAAIEAARAGENGRGFAVVADEVRTLAQRAQSSTDEIRQMIEQLQSAAADAVTVMDDSLSHTRTTVTEAEQANSSLDGIRQAVSRINEMNAQIASAAEEQSAVAEEVNSSVVNIADLTQQTGVATDQTSQAGHELALLAENLRGLVTQFKV